MVSTLAAAGAGSMLGSAATSLAVPAGSTRARRTARASALPFAGGAGRSVSTGEGFGARGPGAPAASETMAPSDGRLCRNRALWTMAAASSKNNASAKRARRGVIRPTPQLKAIRCAGLQYSKAFANEPLTPWGRRSIQFALILPGIAGGDLALPTPLPAMPGTGAANAARFENRRHRSTHVSVPNRLLAGSAGLVVADRRAPAGQALRNSRRQRRTSHHLLRAQSQGLCGGGRVLGPVREKGRVRRPRRGRLAHLARAAVGGRGGGLKPARNRHRRTRAEGHANPAQLPYPRGSRPQLAAAGAAHRRLSRRGPGLRPGPPRPYAGCAARGGP